ncbi:hypothetical protein ACK34W_17275 [Aeromonas veronii]
MASINQGDDAVERLDNAVTAFEQIMTGPEGQTVAVPGHQPQPTLAERVKQNLKPSTDAAAGYAAQAREEATKAAREADRASQIAGLDTVAEAVGLAAIPFPDVWIPLSDSLRMLAGYGREVKVGDDVVANYATLTRNSAATMVNKSLSLTPAAINEARFERDGVLVEPLSTNLITDPSANTTWATFGGGLSQMTSVETLDGISPVLHRGRRGGSTCGAAPAPRITLSAGKDYAVSFWVYIPTDGASAIIRVLSGSSTISSENFNVPRGEWVRITHIYTPTETSADLRAAVYLVGGTGDADIYIANAQVEERPFPTSFIPASGSAATRAADKLTIPRLNNDCAEWYSGPDQINPIVTADTIELYPPASKAHLRNVRGFFTPLTPAQKAALK